MKPSDIFVARTPPFTATFDRSEYEAAAAFLVLACVLKGDEWTEILPKDLGLVLEKYGAEPGYEWFKNPFVKPDFFGLVDHGFAEWLGEGPPQPIRFTELGLARIRASRWNRAGATS